MDLARAADRLLAYALAQPGAWEDHPWGERVAKVGKKVFLFFGHEHRKGDQLTIAVKLPISGVAALDRPECEPTGYGLGKSGWVTAKYQRGDAVPVDLIEAWIVESWRAVAPKTLVKARDSGAGTAPSKSSSRSDAAKSAKPAPPKEQRARSPERARGQRTSPSRRASSRKARPR